MSTTPIPKNLSILFFIVFPVMAVVFGAIVLTSDSPPPRLVLGAVGLVAVSIVALVMRFTVWRR